MVSYLHSYYSYSQAFYSELILLQDFLVVKNTKNYFVGYKTIKNP